MLNDAHIELLRGRRKRGAAAALPRELAADRGGAERVPGTTPETATAGHLSPALP